MDKYVNIKLTVEEINLVLYAIEKIKGRIGVRDIKTELQRAKIKGEIKKW